MTEIFFIFSSISSEFILSVGSLFLLMLGLFRKKTDKLIIYLGVLLLLTSLLSAQVNFGKGTQFFFNHSLLLNGFVNFTKCIIVIGAILSLLLAAAYGNINKIFYNSEYTVLILFAVVGMLVMLSANDFMTLYLGVELQSLCLYILASYDRDNTLSAEAGLKYFILGALSSGILLFGVSLIYGFSGTINFTQFSFLYQHYPTDNVIPIGILIGMMMIIVGLSFKIAAVPFHMWIPDVYQGSPLPVTAFFSIVPKIAALMILARLMLIHFDIWTDSWIQIISFLSASSMVVGAFGAIRQNNIKRLLAYSAIGHVGYMLIGIATQNELGLQDLILYTMVYGLLNAGIFALIMMVQNKRKEDYNLTILSGLAKTHPMIAAAIAMIMLSMAGIPPFAGFVVKFYIFIAAVKFDLYALAIVGLLTSVISSYYYLRVIKIMYFEDVIVNNVNVKDYYFENVIIAGIVVILNAVFFVVLSKFKDDIYVYISSLVE